MGKIIGIDLGTSHFAASAMIGGKPSIIQRLRELLLQVRRFHLLLPLLKDGQLLVGEPARRQMISNPERHGAGHKKGRWGQTFALAYLERSLQQKQGSAFILQKIKIITEAHLGGSVRQRQDDHCSGIL